MRAVDTNVVIRLIARDDPKQTEAAEAGGQTRAGFNQRRFAAFSNEAEPTGGDSQLLVNQL